MEDRPPAMMEAAVRMLVPPASREHVLGDLSERYTAPRRYLIDALTTIPFVVASRLRRTTSLPWLAFRICLLWFAVFHGNMQKSWLVATIPTVLTTAIWMIRDAYRGVNPRWIRDAAIDIALALAMVLMWQALASVAMPELVLRNETLLSGVPLGFFVMFFVRLQYPTGHELPRAVACLSLQELLGEMRAFETHTRRAVRIEVWAAGVVAAYFTAMTWVAPSGMEKTGCALTAAGAVFVGWFLVRHAGIQALPTDSAFASALAHYRREIERRAALSRSYFWWYLLPLSLGPAVFVIGKAFERPEPMLTIGIGLTVFAAFWVLMLCVQRDFGRRAQRRLDQLALVTERS